MTIPYGRQTVVDEDIQSVLDVLRSDFLTQGPATRAFEEEAAKVLSAPYAVSCCNSTAGLYMAYAALGFGRGDLLWTVSNTFVATSNMAYMLGGDVDFVDIDPATFNLSIPALEAKLKAGKASGKLPKIVVPVHFGGQPCDMRALRALADAYKFFIVEDAAHAFGASYASEPIGACTLSDMAVFSFHPVKIITTGEGGLVTTRRKDIAARLELIRSHGITKDPASFKQTADGPWSYEQHTLGFNFRMTDIHAALGLSQMQRLSSNIGRRTAIAATYREAFTDLPLGWQEPTADASSSWHLFVITCAGKDERLKLFNHMRAADIGVQVHYIPVHTQPFYQARGFMKGACPHTEEYYNRCLSLPMYHGLAQEDQDRVIGLVRAFYGKDSS